MALRDQDVLEWIQYAVIEPPDGGASWPSDLWTAAEVLAYANQRQGRLLEETLLLVGRAWIDATLNQFSQDLPSEWLATVTIGWKAADGTYSTLDRVDAWELDLLSPTWPTDGAASRPRFYTLTEVPTLTFRIVPKTSTAGKLVHLFVPAPVVLDLVGPDGDGELLTVPDEFAPALKYGILADMLSKVGRGLDPTRAAYCRERWTQFRGLAQWLLDGWEV